MLAKLINLVKRYQYDLFLAACIGLVALIGYNLGQIRALRKTPITISGEANIFNATGDKRQETSKSKIESKGLPSKTDMRVVASKKSTSKKYHFTWCPSAQKIKEENKIWFTNESAAIAAGYALAGNCER